MGTNSHVELTDCELYDGGFAPILMMDHSCLGATRLEIARKDCKVYPGIAMVVWEGCKGQPGQTAASLVKGEGSDVHVQGAASVGFYRQYLRQGMFSVCMP